ncbi:hypothetical protein OIU34_26465 [Pararhizobium sp. BT-229]|uniref:hypothetical protein n=1 Tax=Pararhizobium sp. BT-229 TaxID=2986923 RepID=UPI0021F723C6|nr:hypothetical protein [Pararhizobium sp. BT-229]MCV9965426.1 hypothetical protein [Pararhizobium sp. BT-229]
MVGFPEGHDRICAVEWLVQRLAVEHCLNSANPLGTAALLASDASDYGMAMVGQAAKEGVEEYLDTAIHISASLSLLLENLPNDVVRSAMAKR